MHKELSFAIFEAWKQLKAGDTNFEAPTYPASNLKNEEIKERFQMQCLVAMAKLHMLPFLASTLEVEKHEAQRLKIKTKRHYNSALLNMVPPETLLTALLVYVESPLEQEEFESITALPYERMLNHIDVAKVKTNDCDVMRIDTGVLTKTFSLMTS